MRVVPFGENAKIMNSIVAEGRLNIEKSLTQEIYNESVVAMFQTIEHCEISSYTTAFMLASELDLGNVAYHLYYTLEEEKKMLKKMETLMYKATNSVNKVRRYEQEFNHLIKEY